MTDDIEVGDIGIGDDTSLAAQLVRDSVTYIIDEGQVCGCDLVRESLCQYHQGYYDGVDAGVTAIHEAATEDGPCSWPHGYLDPRLGRCPNCNQVLNDVPPGRWVTEARYRFLVEFEEAAMKFAVEAVAKYEHPNDKQEDSE